MLEEHDLRTVRNDGVAPRSVIQNYEDTQKQIRV